MRNNTLSQTNPFLKDPVQREKLNRLSVRTSCGVEGIKPPIEQQEIIEIPRREKKLVNRLRAKMQSNSP